MFPAGRDRCTPLSISSAQRVFSRAKATAGIAKIGGIHGLRHAYATHQLEAGLLVHRLQRVLGHGHLQSTLRYLHWVPERRPEAGGPVDLVAGLAVRHG
ncbi:tyrosine-type recombinase/integrase [Thioalkalivibrio paradoxus]|uniref:tyrosine-type recombinase/integrase n=1 Tax=Thioalkalivibrio paradoxus TaxID=108010 RepID=UPI001E4E717D